MKKELRRRIRRKSFLSFKEAKLDTKEADQAAEHSGKSFLEERELILQRQLHHEKTNFISGHFRCSGKTITEFKEKFVFVTLLRNP